jgi:hypothetical protein
VIFGYIDRAVGGLAERCPRSPHSGRTPHLWIVSCRVGAPAGNARVMPQDQFRVFLSTVTSEFGRRPGEPASKRASAGST